jgi:hypothetical protein
VHDGIVLKVNRGDLRISHEVARGAEAHEQSQHALDVIGRRFRNSYHRLLQPRLDVRGRLCGGHWVAECAGTGAHAKETEDHDFVHDDEVIARQTRPPPGFCLDVKG